MRFNFTVFAYLTIFHNVYYYCLIETFIINTKAYQISQNVPKRVYKHRNLVLDTAQPPEIKLLYEKPDALAPFKSLLEVKNDLKPIGVKLAGALKIKQIESIDKLVTVGIDYGKNKIGIYTPTTSETLNNDANFFEKLKSLLPREPFQIAVGLPYQNYSQDGKNYVYYLPQILTCIDFASNLVNFLYNNYLKNDVEGGTLYNCKCQLCLIRGSNKSNAHPSDIICPESYEIIDTSQLLIPPVFLTSESYSSTNSDLFSGGISQPKRLRNSDVHIRSAYLIAHGFEQNPQTSYYSLPCINSLPQDIDHRRLYLKALTRLAKRSI